MTASNDYWLGTGATEVEHLVAQAEVYAPEAARLLDAVSLREGASAIDVGCGVHGILHLLRERVGPRGRVGGLDLEPRLLALAAGREADVETVHADATATGLPDASPARAAPGRRRPRRRGARRHGRRRARAPRRPGTTTCQPLLWQAWGRKR